MKILWPVLDLHKGDNQFVGIMTISSLLAEHGYQSEVVEAEYESVKKKIDKEGFQILAFSTPTVFHQTYIKLNSRIKSSSNVFSVFGGPHPTFFPEMINEEGIDGICIGEGEHAMLELVENLARQKPVAELQNWWIKENSRIYKNDVRPLIQELDKLPLPDHEIFRKAIPRSIWKAVVITSRGCPYNCTYCYNHALKKIYSGKGTMVRRRSVDNVIEELEQIKKHACYKYIQILDDLFTLSPGWVKEFSKKYKEKINLPFSCLVRANHITPEIISDLKMAGCCRILIGVETGDTRVRKEILKRNMEDEEIIAAAKMVKDAGIKLMTANILGIPGGSLESDFKTLELNIKMKPDYAGVNLMQPYPKTEIYEYAKKLNLIDTEEETYTFTRESLIIYKSPLEKRMFENLMSLFPLSIAFHVFLPLVKVLIRLPLHKLYFILFSFWVTYSHYFLIIPPFIGIRVIWKRFKYPFVNKNINNIKKIYEPK